MPQHVKNRSHEVAKIGLETEILKWTDVKPQDEKFSSARGDKNFSIPVYNV